MGSCTTTYSHDSRKDIVLRSLGNIGDGEQQCIWSPAAALTFVSVTYLRAQATSRGVSG